MKIPAFEFYNPAKFNWRAIPLLTQRTTQNPELRTDNSQLTSFTQSLHKSYLYRADKSCIQYWSICKGFHPGVRQLGNIAFHSPVLFRQFCIPDKAVVNSIDNFDLQKIFSFLHRVGDIHNIWRMPVGSELLSI